jgi:hypothetical protein
MKAFNQSIFILLSAFPLFGHATATELDMHKVKKMVFARALEGTEPCYSEGNMLGNCLATESGSFNCANCPLDAVNANVFEGTTCDSLETTMCVDLQECADANCPETCHDELHAGVACILREAGCTGNECSASFKAKATMISFAAGMSVLGWMFL